MLTGCRMYLIYGRNALSSISDKIYALAVDKCHWDKKKEKTKQETKPKSPSLKQNWEEKDPEHCNST